MMCVVMHFVRMAGLVLEPGPTTVADVLRATMENTV